MRALFLGFTAALFLSSVALAQPVPSSSLGLQTAVAAPVNVVIDGVQWRCSGQSCIAVGEPRSQSALRACQRVAARLGPITAFTYGGQTLATDRLPTCNAWSGDARSASSMLRQ